MLVFAKNLVLHAVDKSLQGESSIAEKLNAIHLQSVNDAVFTVEGFRWDIAGAHPDAAEKIEAVCRRIRPRLVYNMMEDLQDVGIFARIDRTLADILAIGLISYNPSVRRSMKQAGIASPSASSISGRYQLKRARRYWRNMRARCWLTQ
jgi:hypothetical protein